MYYFTGRPCKRGHVAKRRVANSTCIECHKDHNKKYRKANSKRLALDAREIRKNFPKRQKAASKKLSQKEGYGVYIATFLSGEYIGSGQLYRRRNDHTNGSSGIARKLKERALSFTVIVSCLTKEDAAYCEKMVINRIGLKNLVNKKEG